MTYTMCVDHSDENGHGTLCSRPFPISTHELAAVTSDVFRWLDSPGIGERLNSLRPNRVVVTDENNGVLFSAFRV